MIITIPFSSLLLYHLLHCIRHAENCFPQICAKHAATRQEIRAAVIYKMLS